MKPYTLSERALLEHVGPSYFSRGKRYAVNGSVSNITMAANRLSGRVRGRAPRPYKTSLVVGAYGIDESDCNCPMADACKHVAALALAVLYEMTGSFTKTLRFREPPRETAQADNRSTSSMKRPAKQAWDEESDGADEPPEDKDDLDEEHDAGIFDPDVIAALAMGRAHAPQAHPIALGPATITNRAVTGSRTPSDRDAAERWHDQLATLLAPASDARSPETRAETLAQLELLIALENDERGAREYTHATPPSLTLRPRVYDPKNGSASLTAMRWSDYTYGYNQYRSPISEEQWLFFNMLGLALGLEPYNIPTWASIREERATLVWRILAQNEKFGVILRSGKKGDARVALKADTPLTEKLLVEEDGGGLTLTARLFDGETPLTPERFIAIGVPPVFAAELREQHTEESAKRRASVPMIASIRPVIAVRRGGESAPGAREDTADAKLARALRTPIRIPPRARADFEKVHLPRLVLSYHLTSPTTALTLPVFGEPRLRVTLAPRGTHGISVTPRIVYAEAKPLRLYHSETAVRARGKTVLCNREGERALASALESACGETNEAWAETPQEASADLTNQEDTAERARVSERLPRPRLETTTSTATTPTQTHKHLKPRIVLQGLSAARFLNDTLPELERHESIDIERADALPVFVRDTSDPTLAFAVKERAPEAETKARDKHDDPAQRQSEHGSIDWFDLNIAVSIGGEQAPFADLFRALAEGEEHLMLPSGRYFSLNHPVFETLRRLIEEARGIRELSREGVVVSRYSMGFWNELRALGIVTEQAAAWRSSVDSLLDNVRGVELIEPPALNAILRPYQHEGFSWLKYLYDLRLGGILGDDMGLGKTIQAIALMAAVKNERDARGAAASASKKTDKTNGKKGVGKASKTAPQHSAPAGAEEPHRPFLVVAPTSVTYTWESELKRFAPHLRSIILQSGERTEALKTLSTADVIVTSYALMLRDHEHLKKLAFEAIILDEAQSVKNYQSKAYAAARMLESKTRFALTGTPVENNTMELWAILSLVAPGLFGSPERFRTDYQKPIEKQRSVEALARLRTRVRPFLLRRTKQNVEKDLPPKTEQIMRVELDPEHRSRYELRLQRERQKVLGLLREGGLVTSRFQVLASLMTLRRLALHPALVEDDKRSRAIPCAKIDALLDQLETIIAGGHRALVFSQFTSFLALVRERLESAGMRYLYLDGSTRKRGTLVEEFQSGVGPPIFLISLKAGGFGLNLTAADYCFVLDPWWNPASERQATDRAHRIGQTKHVFVYKLIAENTIEERVLALQEKKRKLFDDLLEEGGEFSSLVTEDDIRALIE